jgi:hypothetical protein
MAVCTAGACTFTCGAGYLDCDGDALTGCEAPLGTDNCGACGVTCAAQQFCTKTFSCAACTPIDLGSTVPRTVTGTTVGKSDLFNCSCGYGNAPDVQYSFRAPAAGSYTFDTIGSSFDTVLEIRDGGCGGLPLACNDNGGTGGTSKVVLTLAADQVVVIIIDGRSSSQGSYTLHVK